LAPQHVAACASSLTALHHASRTLQTAGRPDPQSAISNQQSDTALVATADAALLPTFIHSYRRLGVLADLTPEGYRQKPLDEHRTGFMLSEAGAAVLLKRLPPGEAPQPGDIELVDTAIATEAHDMVRPSPNMHALEHVASRLMTGRRIDMIHPHAPGTREHDPNELRIYRQALGVASDGRHHTPGSADGNENAKERVSPDLYAAKGALGHSLGAAGLSSLIIACLSLKMGQRPPMPWLDQPIDRDADTLRPIQTALDCDRRGTHAIFASGFAGHTAGAVIERH